MTSGAVDNQERFAAVGQFEVASAPKSLLQLVTTVGPVVVLWWLMAWSLPRWPWLTAALFLPALGFRMRTMLLQHDCGHRSFFNGRLANDAVGLGLGVIGWTPYFYWQRTHAMHHVNSSRMEGREDLGSIMTLTVREYDALSAGRKLLYRVYRHPLFLCGIGGPLQFLVKHRFPWDTPRSWTKAWGSVAFTDLALVGVLFALAQLFGWRTVLLVELPVIALGSMAAVWLIYIQHVFPGGYFAEGAAWNVTEASVRGSSYYQLPALLRFCTADVGLHHVHHYAVRIPNYRLAECLAATPAFQVKPITLRDSLRCWELKLWDEQAGDFRGYPDASGESALKASGSVG